MPPDQPHSPAAPPLPDDDYLRQAGEMWDPRAPGLSRRWERVDPDVQIYEEDEDTGGSTGVFRVARSNQASLERQAPDMLRATSVLERPRGRAERVRAALLGAPIATSRQAHERLTK